jgi:hypothetical protein
LTIGAEDYAARLRAITRRGQSWRGLPAKRRDVAILLHALSRRFAPGDALSEKDATARIQDFLLSHGRHLVTDAVTLRRALVDEGFVDRDPAGHSYRASQRHERWARFEAPPPLDQALAPRGA